MYAHCEFLKPQDEAFARTVVQQTMPTELSGRELRRQRAESKYEALVLEAILQNIQFFRALWKS